MHKPSTNRKLIKVRASLAEGKAAFLLGAGFDMALARDSLGWDELLFRLLSQSEDAKATAHQLKLLRDWPFEMALWAKYRRRTSEEFAEIIREKLLEKDSAESEMHVVLKSLLLKTNLIATFNYSDRLKRLLHDVNRQVVILDREDLAGFEFPEPHNAQDKDARIYLVHLHGRCSKRSNPILDAWSYNEVANNDPFYAAFLEQLFIRRDVISFGVSWTDPPLRNAAAFVHRTKGYVGRAHVFINYKDDKKIAACEEGEKDDKKAAACEGGEKNPAGFLHPIWVNAMRATYGVEPVFVSELTSLPLLNELRTPTVPPELKDLGKVADFLDGAGDYEAREQRDWLTECGKPLIDPTQGDPFESAVLQLREALLKAELSDEKEFEMAARIERHLRHHLYLCRGNAGEGREDWESRRKKLFLHLNKAGGATRLRDDRLRFDFAVGACEMGVEGITLEIGEPWMVRWKLAQEVWKKPDEADEREDETKKQEKAKEREVLALKLLDVGWESVAAKVLCDALFIPGVQGSDILGAAERASAVARAAGSTRRRVKADVVAAMCNPDASAGRQLMLNTLRRSEGEGGLEPVLYNGLAAGLCAAELRRGTSCPYELKAMLIEAGVRARYLNTQQLKFWRSFLPKLSDQNFLDALAS